jgi:hypothetical protein
MKRFIWIVLALAVGATFTLYAFNQNTGTRESSSSSASSDPAKIGTQEASPADANSGAIVPPKMISKSPTEIQSDSSLIWAISILSATNLLSILVSFYLYRWRRILMSNPKMLIPEEFGRWVMELGGSHDKLRLALLQLAEEMPKNASAIKKQVIATDQRIANLAETYITLQSALDERDEQIKRLKQGYDSYIFRRFIYRFIKVDQAIDDILQSDSYGGESISQIKTLLGDAIANCGVEQFTPQVGSDYRSEAGVAENPRKISTSNVEDHFKIVQVNEPGYRSANSADGEVIIPAKVTIYSA